MSWLDFFVLTLAASAIVDAWFNGSIFADWRAFFQSKCDDPLPEEDTPAEPPSDEEAPPSENEGEPLPWLMRLADKVIPRPVAELLSCSFCLSHHTPWMVGILFVLAAVIAAWWQEPIIPAISGGIWPLSHEYAIRPVSSAYPWRDPLVLILKFPAYSLAATRLGNILNSLVPAKARYHSE
jgi:hypothetical protein